MITRIIHANVVCTDLRRSLKFYRDLLGGQVVGSKRRPVNESRPVTENKPVREKITTSSLAVGKALGFGEEAEWYGCFMYFGDNERGALIDLLEWIRPASAGKPYSNLNHVGIPRLALAVDDIDKDYERLKAAGVEFIAPPQVVELLGPGVLPDETTGGRPIANKNILKIAVCKDPDGTALELIQQM
jgi:catechol 2,3-dioxygenase-like lactoylglutathione lyase family enzyme